MTPRNSLRFISTLVTFLSIIQRVCAIEDHNFINPHVGLLTEEEAERLLSYHNELAFEDASVIKMFQNGSFSCGLSNSPKIIGGTEAGINEFPWMAFIITKRDNSTYLCGGSLLTKRHVITAAHCVFNADRNGVSVFLGGHHIRNPGTTNTIRVNVSDYTIHPQYNKTPMANDIAIITLNRDVQFTSKILPICLPPSIQNYEGLMGTAIGWGKLAPNGTTSGDLMKVKVPILSNAACKETYAPLNIIEPMMMCAGGHGKDVCMGDSGGPLMILDKGRYQCIGLVSFGKGPNCGTTGSPGVYTRVDHFLPFIHGIIDANREN